jgi:hypothetical protein
MNLRPTTATRGSHHAVMLDTQWRYLVEQKFLD